MTTQAETVQYTRVETYRGRQIRKDGEGFYWLNGIRENGYFDTLEACRDDIGIHDAAEREFYADMDTPPDTPSVEPWWKDR